MFGVLLFSLIGCGEKQPTTEDTAVAEDTENTVDTQETDIEDTEDTEDTNDTDTEDTDTDSEMVFKKAKLFPKILDDSSYNVGTTVCVG